MNQLSGDDDDDGGNDDDHEVTILYSRSPVLD